MKFKLSISIFSALLLLAPLALGEAPPISEAEAGLPPNHPLKPIETWWDESVMPWWINRTGGDLAAHYRKLARKRTAEALKWPEVAKERMNKSVKFIKKARESCGRMEVKCKVKALEVLGREMPVLEKVEKRVPEEAKETIEKVIERHKKIHRRTRRMIKEHIEKARKEMPEMPEEAKEQIKKKIENISKRLEKERKLIPPKAEEPKYRIME